jgi:DNA end-binding protein Ku
MAPRPYWKGYLKLSLVACPCRVHRDHELRASVVPQINKKTGNRCASSSSTRRRAKRSTPADKGRGYEVDKGVYIQVDDEEIEALEVESNHTIDIDSFVPRAQIDERYQTALLHRAERQVGQRGVRVIREAMRGKDMVALGRIVLAKRERVIALQPWEKACSVRRCAMPTRCATPRVFRRNSDSQDAEGHAATRRTHPGEQAGDFDPASFVDHYEEAVVEMLKHKQAARRCPNRRRRRRRRMSST